jgi:hypothetical protein
MDVKDLQNEAAKLTELLKQAGYKMLNFNIEKIQSENDTPDIHIWARPETKEEQ